MTDKVFHCILCHFSTIMFIHSVPLTYIALLLALDTRFCTQRKLIHNKNTHYKHVHCTYVCTSYSHNYIYEGRWILLNGVMVASMCLKHSNVTFLPCFHSFFTATS